MGIIMNNHEIRYNSKFNFDTFKVSYKNKKAYEACSSIATNTWSGPDLLFKYCTRFSCCNYLIYL